MTIVDAFRRDETRVLDRLVDGELGQAERCELLAALDDEPGAWRRCALAFLEAQAWRHELARVAAEPLLAQLRDGLAVLGGAAARRRWLGSWLAVAASLVAAFGLGTWFHASNAPREMAQATKEDGSIATSSDDAAEPARAGADKDADKDADGLPLEYVTLRPADGDDDASGEFQLPIINDSEGEEWAAEQSAAAEQFVEQLSNAGLTVTRQQRLWPVDLSDGRRLIVPVEEFDIRDPDLRQF